MNKIQKELLSTAKILTDDNLTVIAIFNEINQGIHLTKTTLQEIINHFPDFYKNGHQTSLISEDQLAIIEGYLNINYVKNTSEIFIIEKTINSIKSIS